MNKIKIERVVKLDNEDSRNRQFNIISGSRIDRKIWLNSMGDQKVGFPYA